MKILSVYDEWMKHITDVSELAVWMNSPSASIREAAEQRARDKDIQQQLEE